MIRSLFILAFLLWLVPFRVQASFVPSSFAAQFEQVQVSSLSGKPRKSQGTLKYQHPGKLHFHISSPDEVIFVTDGQKTWYYTAPFIEGEAGELSVQESNKNVLTRFFSSLSQGLVTNPQYQSEPVEEKAQKIIFNTELKNELGVKVAVFYFKNKSKDFSNIEKLVIEQEDGTQVTLLFKTLDTKAKFDQKAFVFEPPPNTKTIQ